MITITIYDSSAAMHDVLSLFKRKSINFLELRSISSTSALLQQLSLSMQILANNGVECKPPKSLGGKGHPCWPG